MMFSLLHAFKSGINYENLREYAIGMLIIILLLEYAGSRHLVKPKVLTAHDANRLLRGAKDYLVTAIHQYLEEGEMLEGLNITFEIKDSKGKVVATLNSKGVTDAV